MPHRAIPVLLFLALSACTTLGPDYVRPADQVPGAFAGASGTLPVLATTPWWLTLHDPILNELVAHARRNSPDLGRAKAAVAEARAALAYA